MAKALCIHDIKGVSEDLIRETLRKSEEITDPKLVDAFYNTDKGEAFFEWETSNVDKVMQAHEPLGLGMCRELLPVTEVQKIK
ncbi:MAG: hypothetical protein WA148_06115 [Actinomycetota bacterium]